MKDAHPNIGGRLIIGLAMLLLLTSILGINYITDIQKTNELSEEIIEHPFTVSNGVRDICINIFSISQTMKDILLTRDEKEIDKMTRHIDSLDLITLQKFDVIFKKFLGHPKDVQSALDEYNAWRPIREKIFALIKDHDYNSARLISVGNSAEQVNILLEKTKVMIDFANTKAAEFTSKSYSVMDSARQKTIILFIFIIAACFAIFIWVYNGINKPLEKIITQIKDIAGEKYNSQIINNKNKISILDFGGNELRNYNILLEKEVMEQTGRLKETNDFIVNAVNNAPISMIMTNINGKFLRTNESFRNMMGYSESTLNKMNIKDITHKDDLNVVQKNDKDIIERKAGTAQYEVRYMHKNGNPVYCMVTSSLLFDSEKQPQFFFSQILNISNQKKYKEEVIRNRQFLEVQVAERTKELSEKASNLQRSQKALTYLLEDINESREELKILNKQKEDANKELEAFSYSVSHDLKAPLRAIDGFSKALDEDYKDLLDINGKRYLSIIRMNANNMSKLINDLLSFSRLGKKALNYANVDLKSIAENIANQFLLSTENEKINFVIEDMPAISADPSMIGIVMQNLISNAVKFSIQRDDPVIEIGYNKQKDAYYIKDNGTGFNMKYADKIFAVFQRLHDPEEYEGTGIGLAIVHRIIHKHNGMIWVKSKKNIGTTFYFKI